MVEVDERTRIPDHEIVLTASRAGGPGGQHVNKVSTRVDLRFDVDASSALTDEQKTLVRRRLARRISRDGALRLSASEYRSQAANRRAVLERFAELLRAALRPRPKRRATRVPAGERRSRLDAKRRRAQVKQKRSRPAGDE